MVLECAVPELFIATLWKVTGNSHGVGDLKSQNFVRKV